LILLRAGLVTLALDGVAGLLGRGRSGRSFWTWVLGIEAVLLLEQAAGVVALALDPPPSLATVRQHALQAGIGLLHEFNHPAAAAFSDAANVFSIWWAVLLGVGLTRVMGFGRIAAGWLAFVTWSCLVGLRMLGGMR
jgi:hypothetical protein